MIDTKIKLLELGTLPRWYYLRLEQKPLSLIVGIHNECIPQLEVYTKESDMIRNLKVEHKLDDLFDTFEWDFEAPAFGFNKTIERSKNRGVDNSSHIETFTEYRIRIPKFIIESRESCEECEGTGKDEHAYQQKCLYCMGRGKKTTYLWKEVHAAGISLGLLLSSLDRPPEIDTSSTLYQEAIVQVMMGQRNAVCGTFGPEITTWIQYESEVLRRHAVVNTIEAMWKVYKHMCFDSPHDKDSFRVQIDSGCFSLTCPGDACGIHTNDLFRERIGRGVKFSDHNVDSPLQVFVLLAGLATFFEGSSNLSLIDKWSRVIRLNRVA